MSPHNHPIKTTLALTLALGAIAPTAALARFDLNPPPAKTTTSSQAAVQVVRVPAPSGFDWGDAGIGAAGGLALSMVGIGGALVISSQRRTRHPNSPPAPTS
jgi:hypothetical protein